MCFQSNIKAIELCFAHAFNSLASPNKNFNKSGRSVADFYGIIKTSCSTLIGGIDPVDKIDKLFNDFLQTYHSLPGSQLKLIFFKGLEYLIPCRTHGLALAILNVSILSYKKHIIP